MEASYAAADTVVPEAIAAPPSERRHYDSPVLVRVPRLSYSRWATILSFIFPDVLAYCAAMSIIYFTHDGEYFSLVLPIVGVLAAAYALSGLYNAVAMHPAQELRSVAVVTTLVFLAYAVTVMLAGGGGRVMLRVLLATGLLSLVFVLGCRAISRVLFARASWWGAPVVVLASSNMGAAIVRTLECWPEIGLRPVALLHDEIDEVEPGNSLTLEMTRVAPFLAATHKIPYAIVAMSGLDQRRLINLVGRCSKFFEHVLVVPDVSEALALWTARQSFKGLMGHSVQHAARNKGAQVFKRTIDFVGSLVGMLVLAPMLITIAVLIKLDSAGSVFYRQFRMTKGGRCFSVLKFRTMYPDADQRLFEILEKHPELRAEYEAFHKLRDDPRVTRVGRVLRRYSLDELPQLWNVLLGDLSLVGPRAYMPRELSKMHGYNRVVLQNRPGITGLWQVSGRNTLSFSERVSMDVHYVQNWTPWLDLYILARTVPVVLKGEGAA